MLVEGKEYVVKDGDVVEFRFNVQALRRLLRPLFEQIFQ